MSEKLPAFNKKAICPKCGCKEIIMRYSTGHNDPVSLINSHPCVVEVEHMERICTRCSFRWAERCVDQKGEE